LTQGIEIMVICIRARYENRPLHGMINATLFSGKKPVAFKVTLYDEHKGFIKLPKDVYASMDEAKGAASLQGFSLLQWDVTECEV